MRYTAHGVSPTGRNFTMPVRASSERSAFHEAVRAFGTDEPPTVEGATPSHLFDTPS